MEIRPHLKWRQIKARATKTAPRQKGGRRESAECALDWRTRAAFGVTQVCF